MVDGIRPSFRPIVTRNSAKRVNEAAQVDSHTDGKDDGGVYIVSRDRRQRRERRDPRRGGRFLCDMRTGRGRRKEDRLGGIEVKV